MEKRAVSRRDFLRISGGAGVGLFFVGQVGGQLFEVPVAAAQIPGGTLDPTDVPKYQTPLLIPPVMPRAGTITHAGRQAGRLLRDLDAAVRPADPARRAAGDDRVGLRRGNAAQSKRGLLLHNAPSLTIEAKWNRPVRVKWINDLVDANGNYLPHLLPVDPTLHWANPPGGTDGPRHAADVRRRRPGPYTGPVPIVTHVHGAVGVGDESDGYAEAWYLPAANNIPAGYATEGTWYDFFAGKAAAKLRRRPGGPGSPPSSTRTRAARRPSGTTTTRSA